MAKLEGFLLSSETANYLKELVRQMDDGRSVEGAPRPAPVVRDRRVEILRAVAPNTGTPGEYNPDLWTATVVKFDGELDELEAGNVFLWNVEGDIVADAYYLAIQGGSDVFSGVPIFTAANIDIPDASYTVRGLVSLGDQAFAGIKSADGWGLTDDSAVMYPGSLHGNNDALTWSLRNNGDGLDTDCVLETGTLYAGVAVTIRGLGDTAGVALTADGGGTLKVGVEGGASAGGAIACTNIEVTNTVAASHFDAPDYKTSDGLGNYFTGETALGGLLDGSAAFCAGLYIGGDFSASIADGSITSAKFAAGAVDTTALGASAVTSAKIAAGAVDTSALGSAAVTYAKMQNVAATSVVGNSTGSSATPGAITASANNQVLVRQSGALAFATLDTASIGSGQLTTARGGTGLDTSAAANGTILIGNGSGLTAATITAGSGVSVTNGSGSITIAATGGTGTVTAVSVASANGFAGSSSGGATPAITLTTTISGILKGNATSISAASAGTDYESPLTFSTGLTRSVNTVTVNSTQAIGRLSGLTSNGFVKTTSSNGTLTVDTGTYLTSVDAGTDITSGVLPTTRGGLGSAITTPGNGILAIGNGSGFSFATLSSGAGVNVANAPGAIVLSADVSTLTAADPDLADSVGIYDASASGNRKASLDRLLGMVPLTPGGRLTLTSATPVTTSDVTGATTVYYCPAVGNTICLWDGSRWLMLSYVELNIALGTVTSGANYDIFAYISGGAVALEKLIWTNDTTRATGISLQDGRYCKTGDKTRLFLGVFRSTSTSATEDSAAKRYVFNMYNRQPRYLYAADTSTATHTYNGSWRESNAGSTDGTTRFSYVAGLAEVLVEATNLGATKCNSINTFSIGIGVDSSTTASGVHVLGYSGGTATSADPVIACVTAQYFGYPGVGLRSIRRLEQGGGATVTFYGTNSNAANFQSGLYGSILG